MRRAPPAGTRRRGTSTSNAHGARRSRRRLPPSARVPGAARARRRRRLSPGRRHARQTSRASLLGRAWHRRHVPSTASRSGTDSATRAGCTTAPPRRRGRTVAKHHGVLARLEDDVEVPPLHRLLRPPAVDDAPLLPHDGDVLPVDPARRAVGMPLDEGGPGRVQSSRGTSRARASGIRDHGATSTTVETPPAPTAART